MKSPFEIHRDMVLGHYGTASWLRRLVLSMWNSHYTVSMTRLPSLDDAHATAAIEMIESFHRHGEGDPAFMSLAEECLQRKANEDAAEARGAAFEKWLKDVQVCISDLGARGGMVEDRYYWFSDRFDEGMEPLQAARAAIEEGIDPALAERN